MGEMQMTAATPDDVILGALHGTKLAEHQYCSWHPTINDTGLLVTSGLLVGGTGKEYRGHVGITYTPASHAERQNHDGSGLFIGFCTFGHVDGEQRSITYVGKSLDDAIKSVNKKLREKQSPRKGYTLEPHSGPGQLTREDAIAAANDILAGGMALAQMQQYGVPV